MKIHSLALVALAGLGCAAQAGAALPFAGGGPGPMQALNIKDLASTTNVLSRLIWNGQPPQARQLPASEHSLAPADLVPPLRGAVASPELVLVSRGGGLWIEPLAR